SLLCCIFLVRLFLFEPFQIPTSSMEPTLIGDSQTGDRIVVDKISSTLKRWNVVVFEKQNQYYVKRLIGLPNEILDIKNGNIYVNHKIVRKPFQIQQDLLYELYNMQYDEIDKFWVALDKEKVQFQDKQIQFQSTNNINWLVYYQELSNKYDPKQKDFLWKRSKKTYQAGGFHGVGEIQLSFYIILETKEGKFHIQLCHGKDTFICTLSQKTSTFTHQKNNHLLHKINLDFSLTQFKKYHIIIKNIDLLLQVLVNDHKIFELDYATDLQNASSQTLNNSIQIGSQNGQFCIKNIKLQRDIYYLNYDDNTWNISENNYFVLGDNPPQSNDSRHWEKDTFIPKENIIGKAIFIFWPLVHIRRL
ncbi:MAG TPA: signal peptidase I, partial [Planctomycetota bacterium]|nr:signal peptidase I [Planctomycetota bacterium]